MSIDHKEILKKAQSVFKLDLAETAHGDIHWFKVWANVLELVKQVPECDKEVAILFAILHDCKRVGEFDDPDHGKRAAEYAQELYDDGELDIDISQLNQLKFAIRYHNKARITSDPTVAVCWDADRLDLPRVGKVILPEMLSTSVAKEMI